MKCISVFNMHFKKPYSSIFRKHMEGFDFWKQYICLKFFQSHRWQLKLNLQILRYSQWKYFRIYSGTRKGMYFKGLQVIFWCHLIGFEYRFNRYEDWKLCPFMTLLTGHNLFQFGYCQYFGVLELFRSHLIGIQITFWFSYIMNRFYVEKWVWQVFILSCLVY